MLLQCTGHAVDIIEPLSIAIRLDMPSGITGAGIRERNRVGVQGRGWKLKGVVRATSLRRCHQHLGESSVMPCGYTDNQVVIRAGVVGGKVH